jgi:hypothetical protein
MEEKAHIEGFGKENRWSSGHMDFISELVEVLLGVTPIVILFVRFLKIVNFGAIFLVPFFMFLFAMVTSLLMSR